MRWLLPLVLSVAGLSALSRPPREDAIAHPLPPLLPRVEWLHWIGAAYAELLADYYWIQTTHQTGEAQTVWDYKNIYPYARMTTELDPSFRYPYIFAAAVLPCAIGHGKFANTAESTDMLERALVQFPDNIQVRISLAYNWSVFDRNYRRAARLAEETSHLPGAPAYLGPLASRLYAQGGDIEAGIAFTRTLAQSAEDPETRDAMEKRLKDLELEGELQAVDRAAGFYRARVGHAPTDIETLLKSGDLDHAPTDPLGGVVFIGEEGRAHSSRLDRRLEVYEK